MVKKTSAHYQREFRRRLRENGLIKKEIWVRPEHTLKLTEIERILRQADTHLDDAAIDAITKTQWTTQSLLSELRKSELFTNKLAAVELIDGIYPALHITMFEYGDLPVFLTICGEQIIVECMLWSETDVINKNDFNEVVLRTHKYFPLSTISLDKQPNGDNYYHMFGALSSRSILLNILFEIETLASNVIKITEAYSDYLVTTKDGE
ncbi:MAG: YjfI family protein [Methylococcales bacterium]|nr:YjfI family protein [Methylococcales bacterium]